jgi:hypothetical protein
VAIVVFGSVVGGISFAIKVLLLGPRSGPAQTVHSWVIVPIGLVVLAAVYRIGEMLMARKWGCLPTVCFMLISAGVWFVPIR